MRTNKNRCFVLVLWAENENDVIRDVLWTLSICIHQRQSIFFICLQYFSVTAAGCFEYVCKQPPSPRFCGRASPVGARFFILQTSGEAWEAKAHELISGWESPVMEPALDLQSNITSSHLTARKVKEDWSVSIKHKLTPRQVIGCHPRFGEKKESVN